MPRLTWLHISDLHASPNRTGWDSRHITRTLCEDLRQMQTEGGLRPDLIFFTGDLAFGNISARVGDTLSSQYVIAEQFLEDVRNSFVPPIQKRDTYIVPGNHDVDRLAVDEGQRHWIDSSRRTLPEIEKLFLEESLQRRRMFERLSEYKEYLANAGYTHLLSDHGGRLIYSDAREVQGLRVGVAGFNSAWTAYGGDEDKAKLWCAGRAQAELLLPGIQEADLRIALMHHPVNWLRSPEDPSFGQLLSTEFDILLSGHEHQEWVSADSSSGHVRIAAGACYDGYLFPNGYNIAQLDDGLATGRVWLREYREVGRGWVARNIKGFAPRGVWGLVRSMKGKRNGGGRGRTARSAKPGAAAKSYETRFRESVLVKHDYVELFGADIPYEARQQRLSVAYVSLTLTAGMAADEAPLAEGGVEAGTLKKLEGDESARRAPVGPQPAERVFDMLGPERRYMILRGVAGGGKSTVLRWLAIEAARVASQEDDVDSNRDVGQGHWRRKVPFLVRLRDLPDGRLPRPVDLPKMVAKELPDPPSRWIDSVFREGRALLLLDGVDEVPSAARETLGKDIVDLLRIYPGAYCVVTTRPGAVPHGWLAELGPEEVQIEEMSSADRDALVDNWFRAVGGDGNTVRRGENLALLAMQLKGELRETPAMARIAKYPLLCAMVCALYRDRNQKLPETQIALCEDLVKMLLHRRERETPGMQLIHLSPAYRQLDYEHKKYLVAALAKSMVEAGVSSVDREQADACLVGVIDQFPAHRGKFERGEVLQGLIERSGLIRPAGVDGVEFVHNTFKEYLAATQFAEQGGVRRLVSQWRDDGWQPVILFAVALPKPEFGNSIVAGLLSASVALKARVGKAPSRKKGAMVTMLRALEFLLVRCRAAVFRVDAALVRKVDRIAAGLFPPNTMSDAETLAGMGDAVLSHIDVQLGRANVGARQYAACVRVLRLVGGEKAARRLAALPAPAGRAVMLEMLGACTDLRVKMRIGHPIVSLRGMSIESIAPLPVDEIAELDVSETNVSDISVLEGAGQLLRLDMTLAPVSRIDALVACGRLRSLNVSGTLVSDLGPVSRIASMEVLGAAVLAGRHAMHPGMVNRAFGLPARYAIDEWVLSSISQAVVGGGEWSAFAPNAIARRARRGMGAPLRFLAEGLLGGAPTGKDERSEVAEFWRSREARGGLQLLEAALHFRRRGERGSELARAMRELGAWVRRNGSGRVSGDDRALARAVGLRFLDLSGNLIGFNIDSLRKLEYLSLSETLVESVEVLAGMRRLRWLDVSNCPVEDVSVLKSLPLLEILDLSWTGVGSIAGLEECANLRVLALFGGGEIDLRPLRRMPRLECVLVDDPKASSVVRTLGSQVRVVGTSVHRP